MKGFEEVRPSWKNFCHTPVAFFEFSLPLQETKRTPLGTSFGDVFLVLHSRRRQRNESSFFWHGRDESFFQDATHVKQPVEYLDPGIGIYYYI